MKDEPRVDERTFDRVHPALNVAARPARSGRRVLYSDGDLALLAARYLDLVTARERRPIPTLAAERKQSHSTVRGLLDTARKRGLLESRGSGKPGGKLTAKGRRALQQKGKE